MGYGAAIGAIAAPVIGGVMGDARDKNQRRAARNARAEALAQFSGIDIPTIAEQQLNLEMLEQIGQYDPALEQAIAQGPSAMEGISVDPRLQASQMAALDQLGQISDGGLTEADLAAIEQGRRAAEASAQAQQGAILQDMQQRGAGGSGAELIARLQAAQSSADRQSAGNLETAQLAQARALQALSDQANLAGSVRGQEFGEKSDIAKSRDLINQFNTRNQQDVQQRNIGSQNQAQQQNLSQAQSIANTNVGLRNQQQMQNKDLVQQQFNNELGLAAARSGQHQAQASAADQQGARDAAMWSGIGSSVGGGLAGLSGQLLKDDDENKQS